jgi:hypothetical protein
VLDGEGNLWYWAQESSLLYLCSLGLLAGFGLIAGVLGNFVFLAVRRRRLKITGQQDSAQGLAAKKLETNTLRWVARIWGLVSITYFILNDVHAYRGVMIETTAILAIAGLVMGWVKPFPGGLLTLLSFLTRLLMTLVATSTLFTAPGLPEVWPYFSMYALVIKVIIYLPGLLFIFAGWPARRRPPKTP